MNKPMLAAPLLSPEQEHTDANIFEAMTKLRYPVLATTKKDGIRALRLDILRSRTLKQIPNLSICHRALDLPVHFDMELWSHSLDYNTIQSIVMSQEHPRSKEIEFHVLDSMNGMSYVNRVDQIAATQTLQVDLKKETFYFEYPVRCEDAYELQAFFAHIEAINGEGICFRLEHSPYKNGRSTLKEQYLVKLCRYTFTEVTVVGFVEQQENTNPIKYNDVGKMDRSKAKSGMKPKCSLGAFVVMNSQGLTFNVGNGVALTNELRDEIWCNQEEWLGKVIKIRSKAHGVKIAPRSPVYWGKV